MGRPPSCDCHCVTFDPNCFECDGVEETAHVTDAVVNIGDSLSWDRPLSETGSYGVSVYQFGGINCNIWTPGPFCTVLQHSGSFYWFYESAGIEEAAGDQTLQRRPDNGCLWKRRWIKVLQQVFHSARNESGSHYPAEYEIVTNTYPYSNPPDASDQWADIVYPSADSRCDTVFGPWSPGTGPFYLWKCQNANLNLELNLSIVVRTSLTQNSDELDALGIAVGDKFWNLVLSSENAAAGLSVHTSVIGSNSVGVAKPFKVASNPTGGNPYADAKRTELDLAASPPYVRSPASESCAAPSIYDNGDVDLSHYWGGGYSNDLLRWIKKFDCATDFLGDTLELTQAKLGATGSYGCDDPDINATKFGITGYNGIATVDLVYV